MTVIPSSLSFYSFACVAQVPRGSLNIHPEHRARELEMRVQRLNIAIFVRHYSCCFLRRCVVEN